MRPGGLRKPVIEVAVNILASTGGRVLLAERTPRQVAAGYWELPGGKIDAGETAAQAAARELEEEIGIRPLGLQPWGGYEHDYRTQRVHLHFFRVQGWEGQPHGREGQRLAWVDPAAPGIAPVLPSNERVLRALGLPAAYGVARAPAGSGAQTLLVQVELALARGLRLLQLRPGPMAPDQRVALARRAAELGRRHGACVLLAGAELEARRAGVAGIHSSAAELRRLAARPAVPVCWFPATTPRPPTRRRTRRRCGGALARSAGHGTSGACTVGLGRLPAAGRRGTVPGLRAGRHDERGRGTGRRGRGLRHGHGYRLVGSSGRPAGRGNDIVNPRSAA